MLSRRRFLVSSLAVPVLAPYAKSNFTRADKVRVAVIGVANRGAANLAGVAGEEIVALCDVDPKHAEKARAQFPKAKYFTDYRKMYDAVAKDIDAIVVSTPDHTHAHAALMGMTQGKHCYCEKPLARTVGEVRKMREAAKKYKLVTQMGTQIHAGDNYRRVVEIVQSGLLGPIETVHVWLGGKPPVGKRVAKGPKIDFDLDQWRGPVIEEFFHADHPGSPYSQYAWPHFQWRYWWEFGGGQLADFGCHFMDLPFWALKLCAPTFVFADGKPLPGADNTVPGTMNVLYAFPSRGESPMVTMSWSHGEKGPVLDGQRTAVPGFASGVMFIGKKGGIVSDYSKYKIMPDLFAQDVKLPEPSIAKSVGHHKEWLDAIRGTGKPLCNFDYSGNLAEAVLLGNVAYRAGEKLHWDANALKVTNHKTANELIDPAPRKGWEYAT
jgi:predicted dehydrogenase